MYKEKKRENQIIERKDGNRRAKNEGQKKEGHRSVAVSESGFLRNPTNNWHKLARS